MQRISYGCQTYPWQMNLEKFRGKIPRILSTIHEAGLAGVEAEIVMLGPYYADWKRFEALLEEYGVRFAALAVHEPWLLEQETDQERVSADAAIEFVGHFPAAKLLLGHAAADPVRENGLREKQDNQMRCIRAIGRRASENGVVSVFHPNSAPNSVFRYWEDYDVMFDALNKCDVGFAPDVGHMLNGGIDPLRMIQYGREKVRHVHFKDMNREHRWVTMGSGIGDFKAVMNYLNSTDYSGWIILEDESPGAVQDPDAVVMNGATYVLANR